MSLRLILEGLPADQKPTQSAWLGLCRGVAGPKEANVTHLLHSSPQAFVVRKSSSAVLPRTGDRLNTNARSGYSEGRQRKAHLSFS